jgi:hypothetical protein
LGSGAEEQPGAVLAGWLALVTYSKRGDKNTVGVKNIVVG